MEASPSQVRVNFIRKLSELLQFLEECINLSNSRGSDLRKLIRSMNFWGEYPWKSSDFSIEKKCYALKLFFLLALPARILEAIFYLVSRYFLYFFYRNTNSVNISRNPVAFFSPSTNLEEFLTRSKTGFWGELKYLHPKLKLNTVWFLIPNKPRGISHLEFSKTLRKISHASHFALFPLAQYFYLKVLITTIRNVCTYHFFVSSLIARFFFNQYSDSILQIFNERNLGKGIAAIALNKSLIEVSLKKSPQLQTIIHLMEGQPWEISLLQEAKAMDISSISVIHTPIRKLDTQILNYFITQRGEQPASYTSKVMAPGMDSALQLKQLGLKEEKVCIVEAHRFIPFVSRGEQTYSNESKDVLFVADANIQNTIAFIQMVEELNSIEKTELNFFIQMHPASPHYELDNFQIWEPKSPKEWGIVIFGPETTAFLQDEYSNANIAVFVEQKRLSGSFEIFPMNFSKIHNGAQIKKFIMKPAVLNFSTTQILLKDNSFRVWRKELYEIFND